MVKANGQVQKFANGDPPASMLAEHADRSDNDRPLDGFDPMRVELQRADEQKFEPSFQQQTPDLLGVVILSRCWAAFCSAFYCIP